MTTEPHRASTESNEVAMPISLEEVLDEPIVALHPAEQQVASPRGVMIGRLVGIDRSGEGLIVCDSVALGKVLLSRSTVVLCEKLIGSSVAVLFEQGELDRPIIVGIIHEPSTAPVATSKRTLDVRIDGERFTLTAEEEIVLRCGKASITLTSAGKILIRGDYVLSRSSGVNRIAGGSVQIN